MRYLLAGLLMLPLAAKAAELKPEIPGPILMTIESDVHWAVGLQCEIHLTQPGSKLDDLLPCLKVPSGWFVEMHGEPKNIVPALIEVGEGKNCLVAYNELCLIRGNRLELR